MAAKNAKKNDDFIIIGRTEALIADMGVDEALDRAHAYEKAGADIIFPHSRKKSPDEIFEFCDLYSKIKDRKPLVVVPSSFNQVKESELEAAGVNIVIYANQLLRSAYPAMKETALSILEHGRSSECDKSMMPIKEILELIPGTK